MLSGDSPISEVVVRSGLPEGAAREALIVALQSAGVCAEQVEASVRWSGGLELRGGRVMIERAPYSLFLAIRSVFGVAPWPMFDELAIHAAREGIPLIVGWDVVDRLAKLYVNGSDASEITRRNVWDAAGLSFPLVPHLLAFNVGHGSDPACKAYLQSTDAVSLAVHGGAPAATLASRADALGVLAGGVMCWNVGEGGPTPRGFFVAIRDDDRGTWQGLTDLLPGWDSRGVDAALPFARGSMRSIGIGLGKPEWTVYFRPKGVGGHLWSLEPVARFGMPGVEVGVFVEPNERAVRAHTRTSRHALNFRPRYGSPDITLVDVLMRWVCQRVSATEESGEPTAALLTDPPAPWALLR
jgi:hypothetical protein